MDKIGAGIDQMRQYVAATASAVDEQTAVTHDISQNMQRVSVAMQQISNGIGQIAAETQKVRHSLDGSLGEAKHVLSSDG